MRLPPGKYHVTTQQLAVLPFAVPGPYRQETVADVREGSRDFSVNLRTAYDWVMVIKRAE